MANGGSCCEAGPIHAPSALMMTMLLPSSALASRTGGGSGSERPKDEQISLTFGKLVMTPMGVISCEGEGEGTS